MLDALYCFQGSVLTAHRLGRHLAIFSKQGLRLLIHSQPLIGLAGSFERALILDDIAGKIHRLGQQIAGCNLIDDTEFLCLISRNRLPGYDNLQGIF